MDDRERAIFERVVTGINKALLRELEKRGESVDGETRKVIVEVDGAKAHVLLNAIIAATAGIIASSPDAFAAYTWFCRELGHTVRDLDLQHNSSEGKSVH